jgi:hypothetical protein
VKDLCLIDGILQEHARCENFVDTQNVMNVDAMVCWNDDDDEDVMKGIPSPSYVDSLPSLLNVCTL